MATITYDTHKFIRRLREGGFDERQAEALSEALLAAEFGQDLASRRDIEILRQETREQEFRLEARIGDIKFDLVKWIAGMLLAQAGLVAALVKLL